MSIFNVQNGRRALAAAVLLAAGVSAASAQVVIRYSAWLPPKHTLNQHMILPWAAEVERVTAGRVKVEVLPKSVGSAAAQFDVVRDGLADLSIVLPSYTPGRFPLLEMGELPLLSSDPAKLAVAFNEVYIKHLAAQKPFAGTHVLTVFSTPPTHILTRAAVVTSADQLKGMKLRASTANFNVLANAIGAVPIQKPASEIYELASTGVIDGTFLSESAVADWNLAKALPYVTLVPGGMGQSVMAVLLNEATWGRISVADRKLIGDISGSKLAAAAGKAYAEQEQAARPKLLAAGVTITDGGPKLVAELKPRLASLEQGWSKRAKEAGMADPDAALATFRAALN